MSCLNQVCFQNEPESLFFIYSNATPLKILHLFCMTSYVHEVADKFRRKTETDQ